MAIAISGQYVFRPPIRKGSVRGGSRLAGMIYPDTTLGKVFVPTTGEGFTHQELFEIAEFVKNKAFSRLSSDPKKPPVRARPVGARRAKASSK